MSKTLREQMKLRPANVHRYFPTVLSKAKEFIHYGITTEKELDLLLKHIKARFFDNFVMELDAKGCDRWEQMLKLYPPIGASVEERRILILSKIFVKLPYTLRRFQEMLNRVYGDNNVIASVKYGEYSLYLDFHSSILNQIQEVVAYSRYIVPVNLDIKTSNTKYCELNTYMGGYVKCNNIVKIEPATGFNGIRTEERNYHSGYVKTKTTTTIKGA